MKSKQKHLSSEILGAEEKRVIDVFLDNRSQWELIEYPVVLRELQKGESPPDALIRNKKTGKNEWVEITSVSRSKSDRAEIGKQRKGHSEGNSEVALGWDLGVLTSSLEQQIQMMIIQKAKKSYRQFAHLVGADFYGILILDVTTRDPFLNWEECQLIIDRLDKTVLRSMGVGNSCFYAIYMLALIPKENALCPHLFLIADENTIANCRRHDAEKKRMEQNLSDKAI